MVDWKVLYRAQLDGEKCAHALPASLSGRGRVSVEPSELASDYLLDSHAEQLERLGREN